MSLGVNDDYNNRNNKLPPYVCQVNSQSDGIKVGTVNPQESEAVVKGRETGTTDEVKLENKKPTEADNVSRRSAAIVNESETKKTANTAYGAKLAGSIEDKNLKEEALAMTEAINKGNEAKAAESYARLQKAGVFTEKVGKPPYAEALEKHIQEQKNQELAKGVVDDMNTDKGIKDIKNTYDSFGATRKEIREKLKSDEYGIQHGRRQIAKAIDKNRQHLSKQLALQEVIIDDGTDTSKSYTFKTQDGKTLEFTGSAKDAYKFVKEHSSEIYGKEWDKKAPPATLMSQKGYETAKKLNKLAEKDGKGFISESGQINIEKAQAYAREKVSMAGDRGDQNELKALAGELHVKEKDVKAMLRGINIDYQKDRRWVGHVVGGVLGAGVAATDLATGFMGSQVGKTVETTITGGKILTTVVQPGVIKKETIKIGPDGKEQRFTEYVTTPGSSSSTTTEPTKDTKEIPGKRKVGVGDVIKDLALGYTVYDLTSKGLNKVLMHDPNILKKGHTLADALDNPDKNYLKKKSNNEVMSLISKAELKGYTPEETRAIKLQLLEKCMGDSGEKLNRRELFGVLATLKSIPAKKEEPTDDVQDDNPDNNTPTTTERTLIDLGDNGFVDLETGKTLTGDDGKTPLTSITGDDGKTIAAEGAKGSAVDWKKLQAHGLDPATHPDRKFDPAQSIIAAKISDIERDSSLSGIEAYKYPKSMPFTDSTNANDKGKTSNTYRFEKLPVGSPLIPKGEDGQPLQGVFYHIVSAQDDASGKNIKGNHEEVYWLEEVNISKDRTVSKKDSNGNTTNYTIPKFDYHMHQYKGYAGSNQSVGDYVNDQNPNYKVNKGKTHKTRRR